MHSNRCHKRFICFLSFPIGHTNHLESNRVDLLFSRKYWLIYSNVYENLRFSVTSFHHYFRNWRFMRSSQFCVEKYGKLSSKHQREGKLIENIEDIRWMKQPFRNFQDFYRNKNLYCKAGSLLTGQIIPESTRYVPLTKDTAFHPNMFST